MQLSYFVVDETGQLCKVDREIVEGLWQGRRKAGELDCSLGDELRLITVLCDEDLLPIVSYFLRLELAEGVITNRSKIDAFEAVSTRHRRRYDHPAAQHQFQGWPNDWPYQLAVALDVPAAYLRKLGIGGPLLLSELWGLPMEKVMQYFEEAANEWE